MASVVGDPISSGAFTSLHSSTSWCDSNRNVTLSHRALLHAPRQMHVWDNDGRKQARGFSLLVASPGCWKLSGSV